MKHIEPRYKIGLVTIIALLIVLIFFAIIVSCANHFSWELDLTTTELYTLSPESKEALKELPREVEIVVLNTEDQFLSSNPFPNSSPVYTLQIHQLLEKYSRLSTNISLHYVDFNSYITNSIDSVPQNIKPNDIIFRSGEQVHKLSFSDIFYTPHGTNSYSEIQSIKAEQLLTSSIINVTNDSKTYIAIANGYGQSPLIGLTDILEQYDYQIVPIQLEKDEIPPECSLLILPSPQWDYDKSTIDKIESFLADTQTKDKSIFYIASYHQPNNSKLPKLNQFLKSWGIMIGDHVIFEDDSSLQIDFPSLYKSRVNYSSSLVALSQLQPVVYFARPLILSSPLPASIQAVPLWETSEKSGISSLHATNANWTITPSEYTGPFPVMVLLQKVSEHHASNVAVLSSDLSVDATVLNNNLFANKDFLLNFFDILTNKNNRFSIPTKNNLPERFAISHGAIQTYHILFLYCIPFVCFLFGALTFLKRR